MLFGTESFEIEVIKSIHGSLQCGFMDGAMKFFSSINDAGLLWIVTAIVLICTKKYRRNGVFLGVGLLLGLILGNGVIKNLVARPRPCWLDSSIALLIENPTDFSFPSGHTLSSFIAAFVLLDTDRRMGIPAVCAATVIGFSRMYLMVHYPTDILGAVILAALIFFGMKFVLGKMRRSC